MTILKPVTGQDNALKGSLQEAANRAKLNLSEVLALNKQYGTSLEYVPSADSVELTVYVGKKAKEASSFFDMECIEFADDIAQKSGGIVHTLCKINNKVKSSFEGNLRAALTKLKKVM